MVDGVPPHLAAGFQSQGAAQVTTPLPNARAASMPARQRVRDPKYPYPGASPISAWCPNGMLHSMPHMEPITHGSVSWSFQVPFSLGKVHRALLTQNQTGGHFGG